MIPLSDCIYISIHASTREATVHRVCHWICPEISIHASTREATCRRGATSSSSPNFNPRLYARGDQEAPLLVTRSLNFNPRLYARGDSTIYIILIQILPIELGFLLSILLPNAQGYQKSYIKLVRTPHSFFDYYRFAHQNINTSS